MVYVVLVLLGLCMVGVGCYTMLFHEEMNTIARFIVALGILITLVGFGSNEHDVKQREILEGSSGVTAGVVPYINSIEVEPIPVVSVGNENETILNVNEFAPEEDVDLLARLMTAEMGYGASEEEYFLTGAVVWNRMNSDDFPDTLEEVIYQHSGDRYQYECVKNGHIEREYDDLAWEIANEILIDGVNGVPEDLVFQAEFEQGHGVWKQVGRTYFCYE